MLHRWRVVRSYHAWSASRVVASGARCSSLQGADSPPAFLFILMASDSFEGDEGATEDIVVAKVSNMMIQFCDVILILKIFIGLLFIFAVILAQIEELKTLIWQPQNKNEDLKSRRAKNCLSCWALFGRWLTTNPERSKVEEIFSNLYE